MQMEAEKVAPTRLSAHDSNRTVMFWNVFPTHPSMNFKEVGDGPGRNETGRGSQSLYYGFTDQTHNKQTFLRRGALL